MYKFFLFYFIFISRKSVGENNKITNNVQSDDHCNRCKTLTDSFKFWFEKTSRGKYEGGDAAWEEAKLKSYARSEIRLVEIQENLCSDLTKTKQDQCYALNEQVEQVLETWWRLKNTDNIDLYTWLCIENLMYCCPRNHYGQACTPCPFKNDKICNGHGICNGEGTRQGNGTCICSIGYVGTNCEECDKNYFKGNENCEPCHKACLGCHSSGSAACLECAKGWFRESNVCIDINECNEPSVCKTNEFCVNSEGYHCKICDKNCNTCIGVGPLNCSSCDTTKVLVSGKCVESQILQQNLYKAIMRIFLYLIFILALYFILQQSKSIASMLILSFSFIIYYIERTCELNVINLILNLSYIPDMS